jgi:NADH:ubiquinone oxidoreductase subunit E
MSEGKQGPFSSQEPPTGSEIRSEMTAQQQRLVADVSDSCHTFPGKPNILKALLSLQEHAGYVPPESIPQMAAKLEVTEAEIAGVLTYYPDLHTRRRGRHIIRLCLGEACVANRGMRLLAEVTDELRIGIGGTTHDGQFTLERVYCLGNCGVGPTVMVDETIYGRMTGAALVDLLKSQKPTS